MLPPKQWKSLPGANQHILEDLLPLVEELLDDPQHPEAFEDFRFYILGHTDTRAFGPEIFPIAEFSHWLLTHDNDSRDRQELLTECLIEAHQQTPPEECQDLYQNTLKRHRHFSLTRYLKTGQQSFLEDLISTVDLNAHRWIVCLETTMHSEEFGCPRCGSHTYLDRN